jgi:hypothetical protein
MTDTTTTTPDPVRIADDAIGLFLEYRDQHGRDEEAARIEAVQEVREGYGPEARAALAALNAPREVIVSPAESMICDQGHTHTTAGPSLTCPYCGAVDSIEEVDTAMRMNRVDVYHYDEDAGAQIAITTRPRETSVDWEHDSWTCSACNKPVSIPTGIDVNYG